MVIATVDHPFVCGLLLVTAYTTDLADGNLVFIPAVTPATAAAPATVTRPAAAPAAVAFAVTTPAREEGGTTPLAAVAFVFIVLHILWHSTIPAARHMFVYVVGTFVAMQV
jgi:hypothetical protein